MSIDELAHIGTPRHSGRYPWGSGDDPYQNNSNFLGYVADLQKQGLSSKEIADGLGMTVTKLRTMKTVAKNEKKAADTARAVMLRDKGMSTSAIGRQMGQPESSIRSMLNASMLEKTAILESTKKVLKDEIDSGNYLDIGVGSERHMGVSRTKFNAAISLLEDDGYKTRYAMIEQAGNPGNFTNTKVLIGPDTDFPTVMNNLGKIKVPGMQTDDGGRTYQKPPPPLNIDSKRLVVKYGPDGGDQMDGIIELRRGVDDISLGNSRYSQVRIAVDGTHYLKGVAIYADDLPDGVDLRFNTNKTSTGDKLDALKPQKDEPGNPFGSQTKPWTYIDKDGNQKTSALNIVNDEGDWANWNNSLSSQLLSKQPTALAKRQLELAYMSKKDELDEINSLTNPTVKKKLLQSFADGCDSDAAELRGASLPRQGTHVIIPVKGIKDTEVYAPNYRDGETVALVRFPHGGTFEIPQLTVNNKVAAAKKTLGTNPADAIGISAKVAARLSGADFDGDSVVVIPNNSGAIKSSRPLKGLENFDPHKVFPHYEGMSVMSKGALPAEMGKISNLITDMTIKGAHEDELARAVRHSMVVIDAPKHKLNYKESYAQNNIAQLKEKYQRTGSKTGAATLISRASADERVAERKLRSAQDGGPIDPATGKLVYVPTGAAYTVTKINSKTGVVTEKVIPRTTKITRMSNVDDAFDLSSGQPMEKIYATHANKLKAMANESRKALIATPLLTYSPSAAKVYTKEVGELKAALDLAIRHRPLERRAQILAAVEIKAKTSDNPDLSKEELKKVRTRALSNARSAIGASKPVINITPQRWEAIQAGAIHDSMLKNILNNANLEQIKELATPRTTTGLTPAKLSRAKLMLAAGYTTADVAEALGVSTTTISRETR